MAEVKAGRSLQDSGWEKMGGGRPSWWALNRTWMAKSTVFHESHITGGLSSGVQTDIGKAGTGGKALWLVGRLWSPVKSLLGGKPASASRPLSQRGDKYWR